MIFFSVSLSHNIPTIKKSIFFFKKKYRLDRYFIIVPGNHYKIFNEELNNYNFITIINEDLILTYSDFKDILTSLTYENISEENSKWYYQQVLKIIFCLKGEEFDSNYKFPSVMFDADSFPIRKIKFFNNTGQPLIYGSLLEKHNDYLMVLNEIYNYKFNIKSGCTVQFFSCNKSLCEFILEYIKKVNNIRFVNNIEIVKFVLQSIIRTHSTFKGQKFSEQEFFSMSSMYKNKNYAQLKILSFRSWNLTSNLNMAQIYILKLFGYSLITYEKQERFTNTINFSFFKILLSSLYFQLRNFIKFYLLNK